MVLFVWMMFATTAYAVEDVRVVGLLGERAVVTLDGVRRLLAPQQRSAEGVTLIGVDEHGATLEFDGRTRYFPLGDRAGTRFSSSGQQRIMVYRDAAGMFSTQGAINGVTARFLVDTGASRVAMSVDRAVSLGIDYRSRGRSVTVQTAAGPVGAYEITLDEIRVGGVVQRGVGAFVVEGVDTGFVLLGMTFLERFTIAKDGRAMRLDLKY